MEMERRTCRAGERVPATLAVGGDVVDEEDVLVHRPGAPPEVGADGDGGGLVVVAAAACDDGWWCCGGGGRGRRRRRAPGGANGCQQHLVQVLIEAHHGHGHVHIWIDRIR